MTAELMGLFDLVDREETPVFS